MVTRASVTNRKGLRKKLLIGRRDLRGFVVLPDNLRIVRLEIKDEECILLLPS